jgi:hypothetical protein
MRRRLSTFRSASPCFVISSTSTRGGQSARVEVRFRGGPANTTSSGSFESAPGLVDLAESSRVPSTPPHVRVVPVSIAGGRSELARDSAGIARPAVARKSRMAMPTRSGHLVRLLRALGDLPMARRFRGDVSTGSLVAAVKHFQADTGSNRRRIGRKRSVSSTGPRTSHSADRVGPGAPALASASPPDVSHVSVPAFA